MEPPWPSLRRLVWESPDLYNRHHHASGEPNSVDIRAVLARPNPEHPQVSKETFEARIKLMPEMVFDIRWPDGTTERCYSPSTVVSLHIEAGAVYALADFRERARAGLTAASERVRAKFGFYCSSSAEQLETLESHWADFGPHGPVRVLGLSPKSTAPSHESLVEAEKHRRRDWMSAHPLEGHYDVIIVGGGQAGLAVSYHLKAGGIRHLVLERERVAHAWRNERWDSFCLVTPNWQCRLPGFPYRGDDPDGFMGKQAIVEYVEGFAESFEPPLHEAVDVQRISPASDSGFRVSLRQTTNGATVREVSADQVVMAVGAYQRPRIPGSARELPESIVQIHSSAYRNPQQLPDGGVLVVGTGQSGCQIAEDLHYAGRPVYLSLGNAPRAPRRYRGRDVVAWLEEMGHYDRPITEFDDPDTVRGKTNHYVTGRDGGKDIDLRVHATQGMQLLGRLECFDTGGMASFRDDVASQLDGADATYRRICASIDAHIAERRIDAPSELAYVPSWYPGETPRQLNLDQAGIVAVVWAIGFETSFGLIEADVFDETGQPRHTRGVTDCDGLYFVGLPWLHSWGSARFSHVDRDARYLAAAILQRAKAQQAV